MCGIVGSKSRESGFDLYQQNLTRGFYSSSVMGIYPGGFLVTKKEGSLTEKDVPTGADYYLFHSRGPTVETNSFDWDDNHPFQYGRFIVAHNGIIENANSLYGGDIGVDSRVIPYIIDQEYRNIKNANQSILNSVNKLQGTFGLWIFDTTSKQIRIVRHDTTLFYYGTEFSSSNPGYMKEVPQDKIFKFDIRSNTITDGEDIKLTKKPKYFISSNLK